MHPRIGDFALMDNELASPDGDVALMENELASQDGDVALMENELASQDGYAALMYSELASQDGDIALVYNDLAYPDGDAALMENALAPQETSYELMFEARPLFSGTLFNMTGNLVHSKKMAETESYFLIKNVYIANFRKTNFCFDADRHCVGTTIAWKEDSVRVRRAAKHHRVKKNIVINSQDFSNASTNVTSGSLVNMFWGASHIAVGIVDSYCAGDALLKVKIK